MTSKLQRLDAYKIRWVLLSMFMRTIIVCFNTYVTSCHIHCQYKEIFSQIWLILFIPCNTVQTS